MRRNFFRRKSQERIGRYVRKGCREDHRFWYHKKLCRFSLSSHFNNFEAIITHTDSMVAGFVVVHAILYRLYLCWRWWCWCWNAKRWPARSWFTIPVRRREEIPYARPHTTAREREEDIIEYSWTDGLFTASPVFSQNAKKIKCSENIQKAICRFFPLHFIVRSCLYTASCYTAFSDTLTQLWSF